MVVCEHCQTKNSLDSQFCKSCGREVNELAREAAREENSKLVAEGYAMMGEGRTEEAALLARAVLEADPKSAGGFSLQGMVAERMGDLVGALDAYERVLILNPDSALDKIKVQQLRQALTRQITAEPKPNRRMAVLAAAASVVFMGSLGAIAATMMTKPAAASEGPSVETPVDESAVPFSGTPKMVAQKQPTVKPEDVQPEGDEPVAEQPAPVSSREVRSGAGRPVGTYRGNGTLPAAGGGSVSVSNSEPEAEVPPLRVPDMRIEPSGPRDPNEPGVEGSGGGAAAPNQNTAPEVPVRRAVIDIKPSGGREKVGGSESVGGPDENGAEAAARAAREKQQTGNNAGAARDYESARRMGKDDGATNQRLGLALERSGKKDQAIEAYKRAATKLEQEAKAGKAGAKEKLESTKQALRNLQGKGG